MMGISSKKKQTIKILSFLVVILIVFTCILNFKNKSNIEYILSSKPYDYLPLEAKNYIKEVYEETGEVILTEKNKEENVPYLNPSYVEYLTYSDEEKENLGEIPISMIIDYVARKEAKDISVPSKYDMRDNYVTPNRDQGDLGLCWAITTTSVAESYILQNDDEITLESPLLISERQIDYVTSKNGIKDYKSEYSTFANRSLGDGGNFYISTIALANAVSLFDYNSFKEYDDTDLTKMELFEVINYEKPKYEVNSTINVPRMSLRESTSTLTKEEIETRDSYLKEVKQNIMENGGAYVATYMSSGCQYNDTNLNNLVIDVYNCSLSGGHAMQIIGWDDELEYSYCADTYVHKTDISNCENIVKGKGVWILKNSWGDSTKYPYLTYDSLYSSIHFISDMTSTSEKTWDNNYLLGTEAENVKEKTYYLSETKIKDDEKLEKIKFITENTNTVYGVKVYKKDGSYVTFSTTTDLPGLITIEISEDIVIDETSKIIVSSEGGFIDKISIFTSNIDTTPYIDLSKYDNMEISETKIRLYSITKNIPSLTTLTYKLYNSENQEITSNVNFSNNIVAENNINTLMEISNDLKSGEYRIDVIYESNVVGSTKIKNVKMQGIGTKDDPYIITNATQLSQIRNDLDGYYELANDIDLSEYTREGGNLSLESETCPQGFGWEAINGFNGSLDGKGYTIKGLYQNNYLTCKDGKGTLYEKNETGDGLFGSAYGNVTIKNLVLEDFEVNCVTSYCSVLLSDYSSNNGISGDETEYNATFENIALIDSKVSAKQAVSAKGGGLFGSIENYGGYSNVLVSNIYLDFDIDRNNIRSGAYLASFLSTVDIKNIQLKGNSIGKYADGSGEYLLFNYIISTYMPAGLTVSSVKNILSTVTGKNIGSFLSSMPTNTIVNGVNILSIEDNSFCSLKNYCGSISNLNIYNKDTELYKLTDKTNYSTWEDFEENWVMETIDGIPRLPVLKFVDFEYTTIDDISIKQKLNEHKNIYDYIYPKIESAKRISFKSNDENIVKIDEDGTIIPQSTGKTTIHIESYYDGYIKDVPITIEYQPHYTIHFNSNGTKDYYDDIEGVMESVEVETGKTITLPMNKFTQEYFEFKEWNTKEDGTGTSYSDLAEIPSMNDKDEITLYAQWWGKEVIVNFNANGGNVSPLSKIVRIYGEYGDLPIPTRQGYGFRRWFRTLSHNAFESITAFYSKLFKELTTIELTAEWIEDAYTIIYDANGGTIQEEQKKGDFNIVSDTLVTTYANNGKGKEVYKNLYVKEGYNFKEWNTKEDGTGTSYKAEDTIQLSNVENDTLRLYAIWEKQTYSVTFNANEGQGEVINQLFYYDSADKLSKNTFTKEGYKFKEWNTKKDGTGTSYSDRQEITIDEDMILYAIWIPNVYSIKFNSNGGIGTMNKQEFTYDVLQKIDENTFTKEGYKFKEWNTKKNGTGTSYSNRQEIKLTEDLTLYAIWEETYSYVINKYSIDEDNKYIDLIDVNTTVDEFKKNINLNKGYRIEVDYKTINGKNLMYTGGKTKIYKNDKLYVEYTNIIRGDVNGNAVIDIIDYIRIMKDIMNTSKLTGVYTKAADVNQNGKIDIIDYIRIMKMIMEEN